MSSTANTVDVDYATEMLIRLLAIDSVTGFEAAIGAAIVDELKKVGVPASAIRYDTVHQRIKLPFGLDLNQQVNCGDNSLPVVG